MEEIVEDKKRSGIILLVWTRCAPVADMFCRNSGWVGIEGIFLLAKPIPTTLPSCASLGAGQEGSGGLALLGRAEELRLLNFQV